MKKFLARLVEVLYLPVFVGLILLFLSMLIKDLAVESVKGEEDRREAAQAVLVRYLAGEEVNARDLPGLQHIHVDVPLLRLCRARGIISSAQFDALLEPTLTAKLPTPPEPVERSDVLP